MAAASSASATPNDAENRIVGMMVGSAVADALGIYTDSLTKKKINEEYNTRRRFIASYKTNELTPHYPDEHRALYEVSDSQPKVGDSKQPNAVPRDDTTILSVLHREMSYEEAP